MEPKQWIAPITPRVDEEKILPVKAPLLGRAVIPLPWKNVETAVLSHVDRTTMATIDMVQYHGIEDLDTIKYKCHPIPLVVFSFER